MKKKSPSERKLSGQISTSKSFGAEIPLDSRATLNLRFELPNESSTATASSIQTALRSAEIGEVRQLFALYRDLSAGGSHVQAELNKRKLAVLSEPHAIVPIDKDNKDDLAAAAAIGQMITDCENWRDGLAHILDGVLWPLATCEKIFEPADALARSRSGTPAPAYRFKRFEPINPTLYCFRHLYQSSGFSLSRTPDAFGADSRPLTPPPWEPGVRFFTTQPDGTIIWDVTQSYAADRNRHIIYRGHLLTGQRDNFGGPMRAVLFWWFLASNARDWFARYMERYGSPFPVAKTDSTSQDAVNFLKSALSLSTKIGALIVDHETEIDLKEAMTSGGADAHERFLNVCNREISKVIVGQTLSAEAQHTGLGSSTGKLQSDVREDIRRFDRLGLGDVLRTQLFEPYLRYNGIPGQPPRISWGGLDAADTIALSTLLKDLADASLEPTDEALPQISDRLGFTIQRKAMPAPSSSSFGSPKLLHAGIPVLHTHPSDQIAARQSAVLAAAYRGALAPVRHIILSATSPEDAQKNLAHFFSDWSPAKVNAITEEALQLCAAAGAADGIPKR